MLKAPLVCKAADLKSVCPKGSGTDAPPCNAGVFLWSNVGLPNFCSMGKALDQLKKSVSMSAQRRAVELPDGSEFEFWMTPLTLAERTRAQKQAKSDDATDFALQLLVSKAKNENGMPLFSAGEIAELRNALPASVVEALMLQLIGEPEEEEEEFDMKSSEDGAEEGQPAASGTRGRRKAGQKSE